VTEWFATLPDDRDPPSPHWATEAFRHELEQWCTSNLGQVEAMTQVKLRVWSTVWRVETADGAWFVKQNCPLQAFEAEVAAELARLVPHHVVPVTATDPDRGLLLTPDQGPVFGDTVPDDLEAWCRVASEGARLQRDVAGSVDELVAAGLTSFPVAESPAYLEARTTSLAALPEGDPRRLASEDAARLLAHLPVVRRWADEVSALGLPVTLNHNDLHGNNVFDVGGELRFFDFGDALLSEPLGVLTVTLDVLRHHLECAADDPRLRRVSDAAIDVWTDVTPARELRAALPAALKLGRLGRSESWVRVLASVTEAERAEWGPTAASWLLTLLDEPLAPEP
jgi:hypothetical protein